MVRYRSPTEVKLRKYRMNQQEIKKNLKRKKKKDEDVSQSAGLKTHTPRTPGRTIHKHTQTVLL